MKKAGKKTLFLTLLLSLSCTAASGPVFAQSGQPAEKDYAKENYILYGDAGSYESNEGINNNDETYTDLPFLTEDDPGLTCEGYWVCDSIDRWAGAYPDRASYDYDMEQAVLAYVTNDVTFLAMCGSPGDVIKGGETAYFPMSMSFTNCTLDKGYRSDSCWLGVTAFEIENPHDLGLAADGNYVKFINTDDPEDDRCICNGGVWDDPVDDDNYGSNMEAKTASWRFPYGIKEGDTITVWFVDEGNASTGPAVGWHYVWHSTSGLEPLEEDIYSLDFDYSGSHEAWVMKSIEVYPRGNVYNDNSDQKEMAVYLDVENEKVTLAYLNSTDEIKDWGFFESIFDFPPLVLKPGTDYPVNISTNSLGGYGNATSQGTRINTGMNAESWKDATLGIEMWDEKEVRYYSSVTTSGWMTDIFDRVTKPFNISFFQAGDKADDRYTLVYLTYNGSAVVFNYQWIE